MFQLIAPKAIFVLGIINLVTGIMVFLTCRCPAGSKRLAKLRQYPLYQSLFSYHCYIWWVFWVSVIIHAIVAIILVGSPF